MKSLSTSPLHGALVMMVGVLILAAMDTTTKYLVERYPVPMVMTARYVVHLIAMAILLYPRHGKGLLHIERKGLVIVRSCCLFLTSFLLALALQRIPVAESTSIFFLSPAIIMVLAPYFLNERNSTLSWISCLVGLVGVFIIIRPGGSLDPIGVGLVVLGVLCNATYQILSRSLSSTETTAALLFNSAIIGSICSLLLLPWSIIGPLPTGFDLALFIFVGLAGGLGHYLLTLSFRLAPASLMAPVTYVQLIWAGLLGWQVFGHVPDEWSMIGMVIILLSSVILLVSNSRKAG